MDKSEAEYLPIHDTESEEHVPERRQALYLDLRVGYLLYNINNCGSSSKQLALPILISLVAAGVFFVASIATTAQLYRPVLPVCHDPIVRQEWRALTKDEKKEFIHAVNMLAETPSAWHDNGSVYDDFSILHGAIGSWGTLNITIRRLKRPARSRLANTHTAHRSASFLPWHRYTLIIFEEALRKHAGFKGNVPFVSSTVPPQ